MEVLKELEKNVVSFIYEISKMFNLTSPLGIILLIVDIILVTFLVVYIIRLVKDTRAKQIVKGIAILIAFSIISKLCHFVILSFILDNVMTYGVLLLIVVFQPELRSALEKIGRSKFKDFFDDGAKDIYKHVINEIAKATEIMSLKRYGALIVIERSTKIGEVIKDGTELSAKVSSKLIQNIFTPKAPLHDGAIIIDGTIIKAASCILPLASENNLDSDLGTRHRAGVGITEVSDAIVIIVSEETGTISLVEDGKMKRGLNYEELVKSLNEKLKR